MRRERIHELLDTLEDTREIVVHQAPAASDVPALRDAWREARDDAVEAYRGWRERPGCGESYALYVAAGDRADAAWEALAADAGPPYARP